MSLVFSPNYIYAYQQLPFNEKIISSLSKQRIIQKNLVHLQGFPDSMYNENLLLSREYLGQFGSIRKIALVSKEDKATHKKVNSAYITFEKEIQAAYCILSLDSIKLNNQIVRAFFGTTKYCNHFLNNYICFNQEKCMFLHHFADPSDIIDEGTKFGYNEHINLAKKIIGYGSIQSRNYVSRNYSRTKTILPTIKDIYDKEDNNLKKIYHRRISSNLSSNSTNNNSINISNNKSSSKSSSKEKEKNNSNEGEITEKKTKENKIDFHNNDTDFDFFKSQEKSRFFNNNNSECDSYNSYESQNLSYIVNSLCKRMSFFNYFKKFNHSQLLKELEINFCQELYKKTNDNEIKLLLENKF